jgi:hypothetical protein
MDFKFILPLLLNVIKGPGKLTSILKWYDENKDMVNGVLGTVGVLFHHDNPVVPPVISPTPTPIPVPVPIPTTGPIVTALIGEHKYGILYFCEKASVEPGTLYSEEDFVKIIVANSGMLLKDRMHLDVTPIGADGKKISTGDSRIQALRKHDGSPAIDWRWKVNGKMNWNSAEEEDHFNWESYDDADVGCTPVMRLEKLFGYGLGKVEVWPLIEAQYNNGLAVEGPHAFFYID